MPELLLYIYIFIAGLLIGSFANVCILRIPAKENIVVTPSHCPNCGKRLKWYELFPLFSYLFLGGKCAGCKAPISPQYPIVEAAVGLLFVLCFHHYGLTLYLPLACLLAAALLVIGVIDARTREIPPGLNIFILCLGAVALALDYTHWLDHLIGFFAVSLPLFLLLLATGGRGIGGGDIKLMACAGLFLGWKLILLAFFIGCIAGSIIHLLLMLFLKKGRTLALGPYLGVGIFTALLWGNRLLTWYLSSFAR